MKDLPIHEIIDDLKKSFYTNKRILLQAQAGSGKSTVIPLSFLDEKYLTNKKIILLEPRRVAARMVAKRLAYNLNDKLGNKVGYHVKLDSCYSKNTKILVVTEAVLINMIQKEQSLDEVALVIFDEFHERSIYTDLALAFCLQIQEYLNDDLKLLLMSASINSNKIAKNLNAKVISSNSRLFKVSDIYLKENISHPNLNNIDNLIIEKIKESYNKYDGDILVFLYGIKQINNILQILETCDFKDIMILPLHSKLSKTMQDMALEKQNKRKIILSTNIAQTSVTIEGIEVVIDSGLEKISLYDTNKAMNYLNINFISNESAIQRANRAGRISNGVCYKLWHKKRILQEQTKPEILRADLTFALLQLALFNSSDFNEYFWLDKPKEEELLKAKELLINLEMLDEKANITNFGKKALSLNIHPRLAYMILKANSLGFAREATILATLLNANNLNDDILIAFDILKNNTFLNKQYKEFFKESKHYFNKLKKIEDIKTKEFSLKYLPVLALLAYPDRLAKLRVKDDTKYLLSNKKGAILSNDSSFFNEEFLVVTNLSAKNSNSFIFKALKIDLKHIKEFFFDKIKRKKQIFYDEKNKKISAKIVQSFLSLELENTFCKIDENEDLKPLFYKLIKEKGLEFLDFSKDAKELLHKLDFIDFYDDSFTFSSLKYENIINNYEDFFSLFLENIKTIEQLKKLNIYEILLSKLTWEEQQQINTLAPKFFKAPSGSKIKIDYSNKEKPKLSIKIQELFSVYETPKVLNGKVPLQLELLTPALRPIQITYDLKNFWENSYEEVRKELRGKYKKHYWPINPYEAVATRFTKAKMVKK